MTSFTTAAGSTNIVKPAGGETSETIMMDGKASSNDNGKVNWCEHPVCTAPSCPIPFPHYHIKRTESETQLCEQMAVAEMRDRVMFCRLAKGMKRQVQIPQINDTSSSGCMDPTTLEVSDKEETSKARTTNCTLPSCDCIFHLEM
jgi:hypothetical protein